MSIREAHNDEKYSIMPITHFAQDQHETKHDQ